MPIHLCNCNYVSHLNLQLNVCGRADCGKCRYHILTWRKCGVEKTKKYKKINISGSAAFIYFFAVFHLSATSPLSAMLNWSSAPTLTTTPTVYSAILPCLIKKIYLCNKAVSGRSLHSDENQWLENMRKQITKINESIFKDILFTSGRISESRGCH